MLRDLNGFRSFIASESRSAEILYRDWPVDLASCITIRSTKPDIVGRTRTRIYLKPSISLCMAAPAYITYIDHRPMTIHMNVNYKIGQWFGTVIKINNEVTRSIR